MITYHNKALTRFKNKVGGKNSSEVDGFYKDDQGNQFFIKKPSDKSELFAELFAGLLLKEFMKRQLIDAVYHPSLICADVVHFEDGSYGLIQPLIHFEELHKIIGTSNNNGNDRSAGIEAIFGPSYYATITQQGQYFGLSTALMFSLLLGAHSVHSGNIVVLKENEQTLSKQFGRIDWGDAFRYFAHQDNNDNLLYAYENQGIFNIKRLTKDYFLNYKKIQGLFPAMAKKAEELKKSADSKILNEIVCSALKQIPEDLISQSDKNDLAKYMCMDSFKNVSFGSKGNFEKFAKEMTDILVKRIDKMTQIQDLNQQEKLPNLYESFIQYKTMPLNIKDNVTFPEQINEWVDIFINKKYGIECKQINLIKLTDYFNQYVKMLASLAETTNIWQHDKLNNQNMFVPYYAGQYEVEHGHAFVAEYKESTILCRLFSIDPTTLNLSRFAPYETPCHLYSKANQNSAWVKLQNVLTQGQGIINTLKMMKKMQDFGLDEAFKQNVALFISQLSTFQEAEKSVGALFDNQLAVNPVQKGESEYFYSIDEETLNKMNGHQLATLCLEELNAHSPTPLIVRIIINKEMWERMDEALTHGGFKDRLDNALHKIAVLRQWKQVLNRSENSHIKQLEELQNKLSIAEQDKISAVSTAEQLKQLIKTYEEQIKQLTASETQFKDNLEQIQKLNKENEQGKLSAIEEKNKLSSELSELQQKIAQSESTIGLLKEQITKQQQDMSNLSDSAKQNQTTHEELQKIIKQLQEERVKNTSQIELQQREAIHLSKQFEQKEKQVTLLQEQLQRSKTSLSESKIQLEQQQQTLLSYQQQLLVAEKQKSSDVQFTNSLRKAVLELNQEIHLAKAQLQSKDKQILELNKKIEVLESQIDTQTTHQNTPRPEEQEEKTAFDKDRYFSRLETMSPVLIQIKYMENKSKELFERHEEKAYQTACQLVKNLRSEIQRFAESEKDDQNAFAYFKDQAQQHINDSKAILGQHREAWRCILANVLLAIVSVGIGYGIAVLVNKAITGHFTFFNVTQSEQQLQKLEEAIPTTLVH